MNACEVQVPLEHAHEMPWQEAEGKDVLLLVSRCDCPDCAQDSMPALPAALATACSASRSLTLALVQASEPLRNCALGIYDECLSWSAISCIQVPPADIQSLDGMSTYAASVEPLASGHLQRSSASQILCRAWGSGRAHKVAQQGWALRQLLCSLE